MRHILFIALLLLVQIGCGSSVGQVEPADGATMPAAPSAAPARLTENVEWSDETPRLLNSGEHSWQSGQFVRLMPVSWPDDPLAGERPILGTGIVHVSPDNTASITLWDAIPGTRDLALHAEPIPAPVALIGTKRLAVVERVTDGRTITIAEGLQSGVAPNDVYFVLNAEGDTTRLGTWIGALAIVSDADEDSATLRVQHADVPVEVGDLVLFVQSRFEHVTPEGTLLFAPLEPDATITGMPELATAVPQYMADYGLTNISVGALNEWIDPAPFDASRTIADVAPETGFGGAVFGRWNPPNLTIATEAWGKSPAWEGVVSMLPGGLTVSAPDGLADLSVQLAPGFISNLLSQRGDHAVAVYLLESVLRNVQLQEDVRFHLREHLALRWRSLDSSADARTIIEEDLLEARRLELVRPLLNVLSIRLTTDRYRLDPLLQVELIDEAITRSEGVLPEEWRLSMRISRTRRLQMVWDPAAQTERDAIFDEAISLGQPNAAFSVLIETLAFDEFTPAELGAFLREHSSWRERAEAEDWILFIIVAADRWFELGNTAQADLHIALAQTLMEQHVLPRYERTHRERLASILFDRARYADTVSELRRCSLLSLEGLAFRPALEQLNRMVLAELQLLDSLEGAAATEALQSMLSHVKIAGQLALHIADLTEAAQLSIGLSLMQLQTGAPGDGLEAFEIGINQLRRAGQLGIAAESMETRAERLESLGSTEEAAVLRERAMRWATAAAVSGP